MHVCCIIEISNLKMFIVPEMTSEVTQRHTQCLYSIHRPRFPISLPLCAHILPFPRSKIAIFHKTAVFNAPRFSIIWWLPPFNVIRAPVLRDG